MTYLDAIESEVSKSEAIQELKRHDADPFAFFAEVGERDTYQGSEVLDWLGY
jgi:hypothetical protein